MDHGRRRGRYLFLFLRRHVSALCGQNMYAGHESPAKRAKTARLSEQGCPRLLFLLQRSLRRGALSALSCVGARRSIQHAGTLPSRHTPLGATEHDHDDGLSCPALALMVRAACPPDARLPLDGSLLNSWACAGLALGRIHVIATPPLLPPARASGPWSLRPLCFAPCIKKHPPVQRLTPSPIR
jgi:hypothetical protein